MKNAACLVTALTLTLLASVAHGDTAQQQTLTDAREHARRGAELFRDRDHQGALVEFRRAYELVPNFRVQYNIGLTCMELQDWACALTALERYLRDGGKDVPVDRTRPVTEDIERLRRRVGKLRIVVDKAGAEIAIDDVVVGESPLASDVVVTAGLRRITVVLAPNPPVSKVIEVGGGDNREVKIDLHSASAQESPSVTTPLTTPRRAEEAGTTAPPPVEAVAHTNRTPFIVALSVSGALAVAGGVTGALALGAKASLHDTVNRYPVSPADVSAARDKTTTFATTTDVLFGAALVGAVVTGILFFTGRSVAESPRAGLSFGVGKNGPALSGRF